MPDSFYGPDGDVYVANPCSGAEGEGFEPPRDRRPLTAFKAAAFNRSATPPG